VTAHTLFPLAELADGEARRVVIDGRPIAVVRLGESVYALEDTCSHAAVPLSEGEVDPDMETIECWKHGSTFGLADGEPQCLPATQPVPVYTASVVAGDVVVEVS